MRIRKLIATLGIAAVAAALTAPAGAAPPAGPSAGSRDARITRQTYVRHDGGTDATIEACNSTDPAVFGNRVQNNEPFSVVSPGNPNLIIAGWNDYCSDWMGLGFSTDGGRTWTDSLVPGYPADTSVEGQASPEYIRTNSASDPVGAFDRTARRFYFGAISYNGFAGPKTNSDVWVASYRVVDPATNHGYPLDYLTTTRIDSGPAASGFHGRFNDKEMLEVDRTGGRFDGSVYFCWTKFPSFGQTTIYVSRSTDGGATFSKGVAVSGRFSGQGCDIAVENDGDVAVSWRDFEGNAAKQNFGVSAAVSSDGGKTFRPPTRVADATGYTPFDGARDCGDGPDLCPSGFVFARIPLEPRLTADPTGKLPGIFSIFNAVDPATIVPSGTSYSSAGAGQVGRSFVYVSRSLDSGRTWGTPVKVAASVAAGHQFFPDGDALDGRLALLWQDSRTDPCYSVQRPMGNTANATSCGTNIVRSFAAVSGNGTSFGPSFQVSSAGNQPEYEMFDARDVPFIGDYNWIQLVKTASGPLFGYTSWTDNRDVVPGPDPRETTQDGFDVKMCLDADLVNTCPNAGGLDQNIYGNSITIP